MGAAQVGSRIDNTPVRKRVPAQLKRLRFTQSGDLCQGVGNDNRVGAACLVLPVNERQSIQNVHHIAPKGAGERIAKRPGGRMAGRTVRKTARRVVGRVTGRTERVSRLQAFRCSRTDGRIDIRYPLPLLMTDYQSAAIVCQRQLITHAQRYRRTEQAQRQ